MERRRLGQTALEVTRLGFSTLPMGRLQRDLPVKEGAKIIRRAMEAGVNFIDTTEVYGTYSHIRQALTGIDSDVVIATKTQAKAKDEAILHIERARRELGREQLDLVLIHAPRTMEPFQERASVWEYLLECKNRGIIRYVGLSTHYVSAVKQTAGIPEVDVIHAIINLTGMGIVDGSRQDMEAAIRQAKACGKGFYAMKALAGGNLISQAQGAFSYILTLPEVDSVMVGMLNLPEVEFNLKLFEGRLNPSDWRKIELQNKHLSILPFCTGCGNCVESCSSAALALVGGKAQVNKQKCILCGYCASACPQFYIRVA